jgi:dihydropteroate synthase
MGILNVTPDSFAGDGTTDMAEACARGRRLVDEGADILDVGGESTRPRAAPVAVDDELARVIPVIERLTGNIGAPVSVDTKKAEVARQALRAGAAMINDISALRADPAMAAVVAQHRVPVVLMHGYGASRDQEYHDVVAEVIAFLRERIEFAVSAGIPREHLLVDPGFGFGKTVQENLAILRRLDEVRILGRPILVGPSRKGTIGQILGGLPAAERDEGTAAAVAAAILHGADIVRVHNVLAMARVARVADAIARRT